MTARNQSSRVIIFSSLGVAALALAACQQAPERQTTNTAAPIAIAPVPAVRHSNKMAQPMAGMAMSADAAFAGRARQHRIIPPPYPLPPVDENRERYQDLAENPVKRTAEQAVSTLSLDVDTGSYANVRRFLNDGQLPPKDAVRIEELLNYFSYDFPRPSSKHPFSVSTRLAQSPWQANNQILRIGVKAVEVDAASQPPANLVFLVDVSGSMNSKDKLELARASLKLLTKNLRSEDTVSMVVYAGRTAVELPATSGGEKSKIRAAIERLTAGGSTNGEAALKLAYDEAQANFKPMGINRILLMTDGDFNVGMSDTSAIIDMVEANRKRGISLSTLGFGTGNYNEHMMEQIADTGNGNYSYIDSLTEAQKVFGEELSATFNTVAKDVKLQLEFNPAVVSEWRLIGYENRVLAEQDFNNDKVDAAEIGAGKSVVALYEITPVGKQGLLDPRRYSGNQNGNQTTATTGKPNELGYLKVRYKQPKADTSTLFSLPISKQTQTADADMNFSMAVAGFGQLLRGSNYTGAWSYADAKALAKQGLADDKGGYRHGLVKLIDLAEALEPKAADANAGK